MRRWMTGLLGALVLLNLVVLGAQLTQRAAAQVPRTFVWKMQTAWPPALILHENAKSLADKIQEMSGGRLKIDVLPAGAVVPAFEVLDAVSRGALDAGHAGASYWVGKHPAIGLFASTPSGPFGMGSDDLLGWMYHGGGLDLYNKLLQETLRLDVVSFPTAMPPAQPLGWFAKPVKGWADFRGVKFRAPGLPAEVFKEAGMTVVILPAGEILPALERKAIDAAEFNDPSSDMKLGFQNVAKHYYWPGLHEIAYWSEFLINKKRWDELPADLKAIVRWATVAEALHFGTRMAIQNARDLETLVAQHGVKVERTPPEVLEQFLRAWDRVAEKKAKENPFFAQVYDSQKEWTKRVVAFKWLCCYTAYEAAARYYWKVQ